ncbi:hypothetical protein Cch01nite_10210 [Cellulomonas chitinilytica]|uniref:DUF881 domain-containing protein n=1 Tax=Cellulomonas chitinilytica TaxID=398759 RepID=A0A919P196_9CELL|nr:hypothetical protein Cch01nite_10210 [Cellulomonas chitinilytica]
MDGTHEDAQAAGPPDEPDEQLPAGTRADPSDAVDVEPSADLPPAPDDLPAADSPGHDLWPGDALDAPGTPTDDGARPEDVPAPEDVPVPELDVQHELAAETRAISVVSTPADPGDEPDLVEDAHTAGTAAATGPAVLDRDASTDVLPPVEPRPVVPPEPEQPAPSAVPFDELPEGALAGPGPVVFADVDPDTSPDPDPGVGPVDADASPEPVQDGVSPEPVQDAVPPAAQPAVPPAGPQASAAATTGTNGWIVLGRALRPRLNRAQLLAAMLCAVLGFALVVQVRQTGGANLEGMRQADLVRILDETTTRGDALAREAADLQRERDGLVSGSDTRQAAIDAAERSAATQGILTGRLPAEGPGVKVTLTEPEGAIRPATMLNMLEEMRNAGAEAIELNGQRITASSAFTGSAGAVEVDGVTLQAPYVWIAIGDPDIIGPALKIPGGALAQVRSNGGHGTVEAQDLVQVTAVRAVPDPVYATPVPPQSD